MHYISALLAEHRGAKAWVLRGRSLSAYYTLEGALEQRRGWSKTPKSLFKKFILRASRE